MESLNLNTLASSLPTAQQNAEKEILNDFKGLSFFPFTVVCKQRLTAISSSPTLITTTAAALSITTLYRSSRKNSKRAYNAGYAAACQDLLNFIQQGVSASDIGQAPSGSSHAVEGGGMTIGRVMDWTEARVDAIKAREEEEDEDEEREKDKERAGGSRPSAGSTAAVVPVISKSEGQKSVPLASTQPHNPRKGSVCLFILFLVGYTNHNFTSLSGFIFAYSKLPHFSFKRTTTLRTFISFSSTSSSPFTYGRKAHQSPAHTN